MMNFGIPILSWDCVYNRTTTDGTTPCFADARGLAAHVSTLAGDAALRAHIGDALSAVAARRYRWADIADAYFDILDL